MSSHVLQTKLKTICGNSDADPQKVANLSKMLEDLQLHSKPLQNLHGPQDSEWQSARNEHRPKILKNPKSIWNFCWCYCYFHWFYSSRFYVDYSSCPLETITTTTSAAAVTTTAAATTATPTPSPPPTTTTTATFATVVVLGIIIVAGCWLFGV